ncbi:DUF2786 domain-containing protein [Nonomuraea soli]|uniref:DUF2786 domain-containing protein n=1 Tax=Nonomuraea soli TaxID=1032476 RepID=A0A7W0CMI6_9ACTN|nr:DUF2786 domain-containing protein [Nonomuraea soli]MBA2893907.1 hypothetical protein [Nonomuraea soli]
MQGDAEHARELIGRAVGLLHHDDQAGFDTCVAILADGDGPAPGWSRVVDGELNATIARSIATLWRNGWQPADLIRVAARRLGPPHAELAAEQITSELRTYAHDTVPERWLDQVTAVTGRKEPRLVAIGQALELLQLLTTLPRLEQLGPIPGQARRTSPTRTSPTRTSPTRTSTADDKTLTRVRALLAKAESTSYEAEAQTFTAAAQRLMAKHSIDVAMLETGPHSGPSGIRVGIDAPYEQAKASLLSVVADANRCRAVWSDDLGFSTVLGFEADLDAVELLFTSLLVQATTSIVQAGTKKHGSGRSRSRSFRESFLQAFTVRVGERLDEATAETVREEGEARGTDLVPLLAARTAEVESAVEAMFPALTRSRVRGAYDHEGWTAGRAAADQARLGVRGQVGS